MKLFDLKHKLITLKSTPLKQRSAGILLHITSLPSPYYIGDFGEEARDFAQFLKQSNQQWWQVLPLNIPEIGPNPSPYSSISSMAGNFLLISPEGLVKEGFLDEKDLKGLQKAPKEKADFVKALEVKDKLFEKAFRRFLNSKTSKHHKSFTQFCEKESSWLDDFALYVVLKQEYKVSWQQWPEPLKLREPDALAAFAKQFEDQLLKTKWLQYIFFWQWKELKDYCNKLGISILGDLPIYVSLDSADVWANTEIFTIDENGNTTGMAGVPPDYFCETGQLWGMPLYKWDKLKKLNYGWWLKRLEKNVELFDLVRLDHFRAFASYWDVPAGEKTAINGSWKQGPGADFFNVVKKQFGKLPFVGEDLGDIDEGVIALRDEFALPGMKVLQFAFDDSIGINPHAPHHHSQNFIVYTGTHDTNTTKGWYRKDTDRKMKKRISEYIGYEISEENIHEAFLKLAYSSVCNLAIIPIQDVLGLNEKACMNIPGSTDNNWNWRIKPGLLTSEISQKLKELTKLYGRFQEPATEETAQREIVTKKP